MSREIGVHVTTPDWTRWTGNLYLVTRTYTGNLHLFTAEQVAREVEYQDVVGTPPGDPDRDVHGSLYLVAVDQATGAPTLHHMVIAQRHHVDNRDGTMTTSYSIDYRGRGATAARPGWAVAGEVVADTFDVIVRREPTRQERELVARMNARANRAAMDAITGP